MQDEAYKKFQSSLLPTVAPDTIIGVRIPALRKIAKELRNSSDIFALLPHQYFEENLLHAIWLSGISNWDKAIIEIERFLPFVDNWSVCDTLLPICFSSHKEELLPFVKRWIASEHTYTCRFAIGVLMRYFLKKDFDPSFLELVAHVKSKEYYVNMMISWYFATALAYEYQAVLPYLENGQFSPFVHRKTIQKAIESFRISDDRKLYLKSLRQKR